MHPRTERMPFDLWHCPGCNATGQDHKPLEGACPGKRPYTAAEAILALQALAIFKIEPSIEFWETRGGAALKEILNQGVEVR